MEKMKIKVNPLPSITWHWVRMNDSDLEIALPSDFPGMSLTGGNGELRWLNGVELKSYGALGRSDRAFAWPVRQEMETGMGDEFARMLRKTPTAFLDIPAGYRPAEPAVIRVSPRNGNGAGQILINAGEGSEASVVIAVGDTADLCEDTEFPDNSKDTDTADGRGDTDIHRQDAGTMALQLLFNAQAGARLRIFVVQTLPLRYLSCINIGGVCGEKAEAGLTHLSLGSEKAYIGTAVNLQGEESTFSGDMGYRVKSDQSVDINYVARHLGSASVSRMNAWGVLEDGSRKLFRGTIDFHQGCPGSKGAEKEDVLLLGEHQVNQTIPLILCHEEDVEGDHGATISRLDEDVLFYLGSRGLDAQMAENMIARARIETLCARIPDADVRSEAEKLAGPASEILSETTLDEEYQTEKYQAEKSPAGESTSREGGNDQ